MVIDVCQAIPLFVEYLLEIFYVAFLSSFNKREIFKIGIIIIIIILKNSYFPYLKRVD